MDPLPALTPQDSAALKARVLEVALAHVPLLGWTEAALVQAVEDCNQPAAMAWALFPEGPLEAIICWSHQVDQATTAILDTMDLPSLKVRERIAWGVRMRLKVLEPHRDAASKAVRFLLSPARAKAALGLLYDTTHALWIAAGDTSTDYNFYTKRLLLGGVYLSTLLYWLKDRSPESHRTWIFLDRRIADVLKIQTLKGTVSTLASTAAQFFRGFPKP